MAWLRRETRHVSKCSRTHLVKWQDYAEKQDKLHNVQEHISFNDKITPRNKISNKVCKNISCALNESVVFSRIIGFRNYTTIDRSNQLHFQVPSWSHSFIKWDSFIGAYFLSNEMNKSLRKCSNTGQ